MHPVMAIGLVFLTGLAWMVTVLTLLIVLTRARRRPSTETRAEEIQSSDERTAQT
ncbi:hypothetical protein [Arthrobacter sp.]|uniref:hypothetical protein n=1 Tax=Arthrobacter sp. TaxID=1667 RepID=UPI002811B8D9|nr:hypothetical protein [Arthrobacter sp.]